MKNFIIKASYAVFLVLLVGMITLFLAPMFPIKGNIEIKIVKSGSMEPSIRTGSIVVIKPASDYGVGDVITFGEDSPTSYPTTHRIIAVNELGGDTQYQVKGDANEEADPQPTSKGDVIGKVIFTAPYVGFILDFARKPLGFILLIALPAFLVIINEVVDISNEIRRTFRRKKNDQEDLDQDSAQEKVLKRFHKMDDVLRPVFVTITGEKNIRTKLPLAANAVFFLVLGLVLTQAGSTSSYFADSELSSGNTMSAMSFEINASALPEESYVGHSGGSTVVSTITPNPVGFPNEYRVTVEQTGGSAAFCQALRMYSTSTSPFTYEGALLDFNSPPTIFSGDWTFDVRLAPDAISINAEDTCEINLVYSASTWLEEKGVHGGYSDVAKVALEFEASGYHHDESQAESFVTNSIVDSVITSTSTEESSVATSTEETNATSTPPVVGEDNTDATSTPAVVTEEEGEEPDTQETVVEEEVSPAVEESTPPDPAI